MDNTCSRKQDHSERNVEKEYLLYPSTENPGYGMTVLIVLQIFLLFSRSSILNPEFSFLKYVKWDQ